MLGRELQELVRRRLWELARTVEEASRKSRWVLSADTLQRMAQRGGRTFISDGLAEHIARALDVPENRVRRAAGLSPVRDERESISTRPHLRLIRRQDSSSDG